MLSKLSINKDMSLFAQDVDVKQTKIVEKQQHLIQIIDRSGSMAYYLPSVIEDVKRFSKILKKNDKITIGWFSGEGQRDFMLKSFEILGEDTFKTIDSILDQNKRTIGLTCFSEILQDIDKVISNNKNENYSLWFFTDGYPVVSNYSKELSMIKQSLNSLSTKLSYSAFVGSGNYYNRDLMVEMAEITGGSFIHINDIKDIYTDLTNFIEAVGDTIPKVVVNVPKDVKYAFSINKKNIIMYSIDNGKVNFIPSKSNKNVLFYESSLAKEDEIATFTDSNINSVSKKEYLVKGIYAFALTLSQRVQTDRAIDVLTYIGDADLVEMLYNAYTNEEYGIAESAILDSIFDAKQRCKSGINKSIKVSPDAFCIVDLVDTLMEDENAKFFPYHRGFVYNRISAESVVKDKYPKFNYDKDMACPLTDMTWNKDMLNLSIKVMQEGYIKLNEGFKKFGLAEDYPCVRFRNYALVKDGFANVSKIYVSLSESTVKKLKRVSKGFFKTVDPINGIPVYELNLKKIPVMNRKIAENKLSATDLAKLILEERIIENKISMYTYLQKNEAKMTSSSKTFSAERAEFLKENGIVRDNTYSPQALDNYLGDMYYAKSFKVDISKFSKPEARDVYKKLLEKKKVTPREEYMSEAYIKYVTETSNSSINIKNTWLNDQVKALTNRLKEIRSEIQRVKFAVLLSKKWFKEFTERADTYELNYDNKTFIFKVKNEEVKI